MARELSECAAPGCDQQATRVVPTVSGDDETELWRVDALTDAAGNVMTPPGMEAAVSGWPACEEHDRVHIVLLPRWWNGLAVDGREDVRKADYYADLPLPADLVASQRSAGVLTTLVAWAGEAPQGPWLHETYSEVLRALDRATPSDEQP